MTERNIRLSMKVDPSNKHEGIMILLRTVRPLWKQQDVLIKDLPGGYLNTSVGCHNKNDPDNHESFVVRIFAERETTDRNMEVIGLQIGHAAGCGTPLLAIFDNGVVVGFARGRTLQPQDYLDENLMRNVIKALVKIHTLDVATIDLVGMDGKPTQLPTRNRFLEFLRHFISAIPDQMKTQEKQKRYNDLFPSKKEMFKEADDLDQYLSDLEFPICLGHGDFHCRNTIYDDVTGEVTFVDYEFFGFTYQAREFAFPYISREFSIYIGFIDVKDPPLTNETMRLWLKLYLEAKYGDIEESHMEKLAMEQEIFGLIFTFFYIAMCLSLTNDPMIEDVLGLDPFKGAKILSDWYYPNRGRLQELKSIYLKKFKMSTTSQ